MINDIYVLCDGDWEDPEVQIYGSSKALSDFGLLLNKTKDSFTIETNNLKNDFYPVCINKISVQPVQTGNDKLAVSIDKISLNISGTKEAFQKLSQSLINFFDNDTEIGEHFHLDYYEGNEILNKTNCNLIFTCDR